MMRRIKTRLAGGRAAALAAGLLVAAGLAGLPALPASASSTAPAASATANAVWDLPGGDIETVLPSCSDLEAHSYGGHAIQVYNSCSSRIWLHYADDSTGDIYSYCVNAGAVAYDFNEPYTDLQVSDNKAQCDADHAFTVVWYSSGIGEPESDNPGCQMGVVTDKGGYWIGSLLNGGCNFRIWVHEHDNGTGTSACVDPGGVWSSPKNGAEWQVTETDNQAPCDAGGPAYPY